MIGVFVDKFYIDGYNVINGFCFNLIFFGQYIGIGDICFLGIFCVQGFIVLEVCEVGIYNDEFGQDKCKFCFFGFYCLGKIVIFINYICLSGYYCLVNIIQLYEYFCLLGIFNNLIVQ